MKMARRLDAFYISARYPDAFAEGAPFEFFDEEQAKGTLFLPSASFCGRRTSWPRMDESILVWNSREALYGRSQAQFEEEARRVRMRFSSSASSPTPSSSTSRLTSISTSTYLRNSLP
jgi:hypothetical protein